MVQNKNSGKFQRNNNVKKHRIINTQMSKFFVDQSIRPQKL